MLFTSCMALTHDIVIVHVRSRINDKDDVGISARDGSASRGRLKTQVRICNGGKRKYSNLKSILKSLRFSSLAFSADPLFTCTVPDRCYTQEIGLMMDSCAEGPGFKNRRRDAV